MKKTYNIQQRKIYKDYSGFSDESLLEIFENRTDYNDTVVFVIVDILNERLKANSSDEKYGKFKGYLNENKKDQEANIQDMNKNVVSHIYSGNTEQHFELSSLSIEYIKDATPWIQFISILGFIISGIIGLAGGFIVIFGSMDISPFLVVAYLIMAIIIFYPNKYLFDYGNNLRDFIITNDKSLIEKSFLNQKKFWRFIGIFVIIYLSLTVVLVFTFVN